MKPARIFQQYIWLVTILRQYKRLTLEEISNLWVKDKVNDGNPLNRASFYRHKDAILDMFGVVIECDLDDGYRYYISNPEVLDNDSIERWMLSTLTVSTVLSNCASLRERILLEDVPAGEEYLQTIIQAIKTNRRLQIIYQRFGADSYEKTISPYALKLFHQRWYLLAYTGRHMATYSLDRMRSVTISDESFEMPADFFPQDYFSEYFGVLTDETPMAHVVIRAYGKTPNYLRTLPLHPSQQEIKCTEDYTDFALDIRPTPDFIGELLSQTDGLEVLEPEDLRSRIRQLLKQSLNRY
ncbi:MAG: WYL domain-containing protein [Prevotella sp.]|nr:WYL domain-containing protein [Prevotella sp.]